MKLSPIQNEVLGLEHKYWQAMKDSDVEAAVALTRFPCLISGPQGHSHVDEVQYRTMMVSSDASAFKDVQLTNESVDLLGDHTAIVSYRTEVNGMKMHDISTWLLEDGQWRCVFHSENPELQASPIRASA